MAIVILTTGVVLSSLRNDAIRLQLKALSNTALLLSKETSRSFQAMELVQISIIESIQNARVADREQLTAAMSSQQAHEQLRARIAGLPYIDAVSLLDEAGQVFSSTRVWPAPALNTSDRLYFRTLAGSADRSTYVSQPLMGRISQRPNIYFGRRINAPDGRFLGIVNIAIDRSYLDAALANIDLGPGGRVAIIRNDGVVLASFPPIANATVLESEYSPVATTQLRQELAALPADGGVLPAGTLDEHSRFTAVHSVSQFPLSVVVSETTEAVEGRIRQLLFPVLLTALLVCIVIGLLAFFLARHIRHERMVMTIAHRQARLDVLTGLPNRLHFTEQLQALLEHDGATPFVLLVIDLDHFKVVNDTLGHDVGDAVMQHVASRISAVLGGNGMVALLGGDEFAIVRNGIANEEEARDLARAIMAEIHKPFFIGHRRVAISCSVGVALYPRDGDTVLTLHNNADLALDQSKSNGRGMASVFSESTGQSARARHELQLELDEAWRERQLNLVYQPIFETNSLRLVGFEALLRWRHPTRGDMSPAVFVPAAEETGLILPIGGWVLEEACRTAMQWAGDLFVSVNLSPLQFRGGTAATQVLAALEQSGLPGGRLELEITESTLLQEGEGRSVRTALDGFRNMGIAIALDDFGTGYSSLSYLSCFPIDRIKLDRSFIAGVVDNPSSQAIVRAMLDIAGALSLMTTAEGIETEEQVNLMKREGCTHLQGYLLGRPISPAEALKLTLATAA